MVRYPASLIATLGLPGTITVGYRCHLRPPRTASALTGTHRTCT